MSDYQERLYRERQYWIGNCAELMNEADQYKKERNTLTDDVKRLNALIDMKNSELNSKNLEIEYYERKIKKINDANQNLSNRIKNLDLTCQELHDDLMQCDSEVRRLENTNNILIDKNSQLMRRNEKLEDYVRMWDKLSKWKQGKLAERCNNDLLHELSYTMNELERDMYKGREHGSH